MHLHRLARPRVRSERLTCGLEWWRMAVSARRGNNRDACLGCYASSEEQGFLVPIDPASALTVDRTEGLACNATQTAGGR